MEIKINIKDESDLIEKYSDVWSRFLGLTKREQELYVLILTKYVEMSKDCKEPYISQLMFGTDYMRDTRSSMNLTHQNFNNVKMGLKKKRVILEEGESYRINPMVTLDKEIKIKFV